MSDRALGAVSLAEGDAKAALAALRQSWNTWCELEAPYEAARVRVLMALAYRELGDHDAADLELDAACQAFQRMGAAPLSLAWRHSRTKIAHRGLAHRAEMCRLLKLVASGRTNRAIAGKLGISEKTVPPPEQHFQQARSLFARGAPPPTPTKNNWCNHDPRRPGRPRPGGRCEARRGVVERRSTYNYPCHLVFCHGYFTRCGRYSRFSLFSGPWR